MCRCVLVRENISLLRNYMLKRLYLLFLLVVGISVGQAVYGQCSLLSGNTTEDFQTSGVCGPTTVTWTITYDFIAPVDPSLTYIRFNWNDPGTNRTTLLATPSAGNTKFTATASFTYPVGGNCIYEPIVVLSYDQDMDGNLNNSTCFSSAIQKTVSSWQDDNSNGGILAINPLNQPVCYEDSTVAFQFQDATFPNCDVSVEPDRPNQLTRWVQFIYGTGAGPHIPNISIDTGGGTVILTDAVGNLTAAAPFAGPIIEIPPIVLQANLNELTYPIDHPVAGVGNIGDVFEITLRNWNTCNPYDTLLFDALPPTDPVNGDFPSITTTAQLEIIGPTVPTAGPDQGVCGNSTNLAGNVIANGVGQWNQIGGTLGGINITNPINPTTAVNVVGSNFGTYLLEWSSTLGACASGRDTVEITFFEPPSASNAGPPQTICGNSTTLAGNNPAVGTGEWFFVSGPAGFTISNPLSRTSAFSSTAFGTYVLEWRIENGVCPDEVDQVTIVFEEAANAADAGLDDTTACNFLSYTLQGNAATTPGTTGTWSLVNGPGTIVSFAPNANDPNAVVTFSNYTTGTQRYRLRWRISSGTGICPNEDDFVNIRAFETPTTATTGGPITLCGLTTTLNGNAAAVGQGTWSQTSGPGTSVFVNENNPTTDVTVSVAGTYDFEWSIENGNCPPSTATTTVTFAPPPTTPDAGADDSVCAVATYNLSGNTITLGTGTWQQIGGPAIVGGFTPNANDPNAQFTFSTEGIYIFEWSSFLNASCPTLRDTVEITLFNSPTNAVVDLPNPITTCALNNIPISANTGANVITSGFGRWFQSSGPATLTITDSLDNTTTVTAPVSGVYTITWEVSNGPCSPPSTDVLTLNLSSPSPSIPGADDTVCADNYTLSANTPAIGTGAWSVGTQPPGGTFTILPAGDPNATFTITNGIYGAYTLIWTISNPGCPDEVDSLTIRLDENPSPASVIPDFQICADTATLGAVTPTVGSGQWQLISGAGPVSFNPNSANPNAVVTIPPVSNTAVYDFEWTTSNGVCPDLSDVLQVTFHEISTTPAAGGDFEVCNTSTNLAGNAITVGTGQWNPLPLLSTGPITITTPSSPTTNVTIPGFVNDSDTFFLEWTSQNGNCVTLRDTVRVIFHDDPTVSAAGSDIDICADTAQLNANIPVVGNGQWIIASGSATLDNNTDPTTIVRANPFGGDSSIVVLTWRISNGNCAPSNNNVQVVFYKDPTVAAAGADDSVCALTYTLDGNFDAIGKGDWNQVSGPGTSAFVNQTLFNTDVTVTQYGTYLFEWTNANGACQTTRDTVQIRFDEFPSSAFAGVDDTVCDVTTILAGNNPAVGNGVWTVTSAPSGTAVATFVDSSLFNTSVTVNEVGAYTFQWTISNGTCADSSDQVIIIFASSNSNTGIAGDTSLCVNENNKVYTVPFVAGTTYEWFIPAGITVQFGGGINDNFVVLTYPTAGPFELKVLPTNSFGCASDTQTTDVVVYDFPTRDAGPDWAICSGDTAFLGGTPTATGGSGFYNYSWSPTSGLDDASIANPIATPIFSRTYFLTVTDSLAGCASIIDTVNVTVNPSPSSNLLGLTPFICEEDTGILQIFFNTGTGPFSVGISNGVDTTIYPSLTTGDSILVTPDSTLTYRVVYLLDSATLCTGTSFSGAPIINVRPLPNAVLTSLDTVICEGDAANLNLNISGPTPQIYTVEYAINGRDTTIVNLSGSSTVITVFPDSSSEYTLISVTDNFRGCRVDAPSVRFTDSVFIQVDSLPRANLVGADTICVGDSAALVVNLPTGDGPFDLTIQGLGVVNNYNSGDTIWVKPTSTRNYIITQAADTNGCTTTSTTLLTGNALIVVNPLPVANLIGTNTICIGDSTPLQINVTTGTSPFEVVLSNGDTINPYNNGDQYFVSPLVTTTYSLVSVLDTNGCYTSAPSSSLTGTPQVTVNPLPTAQVASDDTICFGDNVILTFSFTGAAPYTFTFRDNSRNVDSTLTTTGALTSRNVTVSPDTTTLYTLVSVQGANGCIDSINNPNSPTFGDTVEIVVDSLPVATIVADLPTDTICNGDLAYLFVNVSTGPGPYTITVNNGVGTINNYNSGDTITVSPSVTTEYQITSLLDQNGCSVSFGHPNINDTARIVVNPLPVANLTGTATICLGDTTPLSVAIAPGTGPFSVVINDGTTNDTINSYVSGTNIPVAPIVTTTYSLVSVLDSFGCYTTIPSANLTGTPQVTVNPLPTAQITQDDTICFGDNVTLNFSFTGTAPFIVIYKDNSTGINDTVTTTGLSTSATAVVSPDTTTLYSLVSVQGANGCIDSINNPINPTFGDTVEIVVDSLPVATIVADLPTDTICNGDLAYLFVNVSTGPGPYTITVNNGVGTINNYNSGDTITVSPSVTTEYQITSLLDQNGCSVSFGHPNINDTARIVVNPLPVANLTGTATICLGDTTPLSVAIAPGTGPFSVVINDGTTNDTINSYVSGTNIPVAPIVTTTYSLVSVLDSFGCYTTIPSANLTGTPQVTVNPLPTAQITQDDTICFGDNVTLNFSFTGTAPFIAIYKDNTTGINDTVTTTGLSTSATAVVSPDTTTLYSLVSVQGANGCIDSVNNPINITFGDTVEIVVDSLPVATIVADLPTDTICNGDLAYLFVNVSTGPGPYTITVNNGVGTINNYNSGDTITVSPSVTTEYQITSLLDQNGCSVSFGHPNINDTARIVVNPLPVANLTGTATICLGDTTPLSVAIAPGTGPFSVVINDGTTNDTINSYVSGTNIPVAPIVTTTYSLVSVLDSFGCYTTIPSANLTGTPQVTVNPLPTAQITQDDTICFGDNVTLNFSFTGTAPFIVIYKDNSTGINDTVTTTGLSTSATAVVSPDTTTLYSLVSVQGANGCIDSINNPINPTFGDTVEIVVDSLPVATIVADLPTDTICNGDLAYLFVNVSTGPGPYDITINNGVGTINNYVSGDTITVSPSVTTAYQITSLLDQNGCSVSFGHPNIDDTATIVVNPLPSVTLSIDTNRICFGDTTNLRVALNVGTGPLEFVVNPNVNDTIRNFDPLTDFVPVSPNATTTYSINYVIDANGCQSVAPSANITGNPQLNINPLPTLQISDSTTICLEDQVVLTFSMSGSAPYTFTYRDELTGTDSTITTVGGLTTRTVTEFPLDTTMYTLVSITDAQGCTDSINNAPINPNFGDTIVVNVNPLPITTLTVVEPTDTICFGDNALFIVDVTNLGDAPGPYNLEISGGVGIINNYTSGDTIVFAPNTTSNYNIVSLTDANGCSVLAGHPNLPDTVRVVVKPLPVVELLLDDNEICLGDSARLYWRVPVGSPRFDFVLNTDPNDTIQSVTVGDSIWVSPTDTTTYSIIYFSDSFGCTVTAPSSNISGTPTLIVNPLPDASISINKDTVCFGELTTITFNLTGPNSPYTYQIDTTGNILTGFNTIDGSTRSFVLGIGDHDFKLIEAIDAKGCVANIAPADSLVEVFVHELPTASISGDTSVCDLEPFVLNFNLTGNDPLNVYFTDGTNNYVRQLTAPTDTAIISLPASVNPYFFQIDSVVDSNSPESCRATDITGLVTVQVFDRPQIEINSFDTTICDGDQAILSFDISGGRAPFEVDLSVDGTTVDTTLLNIADGSIYLVRPNDTTTYTILEIRESVTTEACVGTIGIKSSFTVNVNPLPTANLTLVGQDTKCFGDSITVNIQFTGQAPYNLSLLTNYAGPITMNGIQTNDTTFNVSSSFPGFGNTISLFTLSDGHTPTCSVIQGDPQLTGGVTFNLNDLPTASLNPLGLTSICRGDSANLLVVVSQGDLPYTVYISDGSTNYVDSLLITTGNTGTIAVGPQNTSTFQIDSVRDGSLPDNCRAQSINGSVQISVEDRPTVSISGIDTICSFQNSQFQIQTGGTGPWLVTYTNGTDTLPTFVSSSPQTVTLFNPPVGLNVYSIVSISDNGTVPSCPADSLTSDTAYVFVNDLPTANLTGDTTICNGDPLPVYLNFGVTSGPFDVTITDGTNNYNFTGLSQQDTVLIPYPGPGFFIYRFATVRDDNTNCEPLVTTGQAIVQVREIPTVTLSVVGNNIICGKDTLGKFLQFNFDVPNIYDVILQKGGVDVDTLFGIGNGTILQAPDLQVGNNVYTVASATYSLDPKCGLNVVNNANIFVNADPTITIQDNDTICVGNTVTLTLNATGLPNYTVQYIGNAGIQPTTSANNTWTITASPTTTTSFRVLSITDGNGCSTNNILPSDSTEATIVVNQLPTASLKVDGFFSNSVTFCEEDTIALQYNLTGNGPFDVIVNDNLGNSYVRNNVSNLDTLLLINPIPPVGSTTQYFLTQVNDNNNPACAPTSLGNPVNITVDSLPTANISGNTTICSGNTATLTFTFTGTGPWTFRYFDGTLVSATQASNVSTYTLNVLPSVTTTYTIFDVVDQGTTNQCAIDSTHPNVTGSVTVVVEPPVIADFTFNSDDACGDPTVTFTDQTTPAAIYSYDWDFGDGNNSTIQSPTHQYANTGLNVIDFTVNMVVTSPLGCVDSIDKVVQVKPDITAVATADVQVGCSPLEVNFSSSTNASSFQWFYNNNGTLESLSPIAAVRETFENNGLTTQIFNVTLVTTNQFACTDTLIIPITVHPKPQPTFTANPVQQNWPPSPVTFTNGTPSLNDNTYFWNFGDTANGTSTQVSPTYDFGTFGNFTVTLIATTQNGCIDSTTRLVTIFPSLPVADFVGTTEGCVPFEFTFRNASQFGLSYKWEFSDGSEYFSENVTKTFFDPGVYDVKLITTGINGFKDSIERFAVVTGYPNPSANFFSRDTVFVGLNELNFSNESRNASEYFWDFGDGTTSDERSPTKNYRFEGLYDVTMVAFNVVNDSISCTDTASKVIYVLPVGDIIVPNAFTPGEGGPTGGSVNPFDRFNNTVFYPVIRKEFVALKFEVFNRWGEPIFQSNTVNVGWDGYVNGTPAPQGVYIYRVQVEFADGTKETKVGDVTLLR